MRKISAALIGTALAATALAGCTPAPGTSSSFGCTPMESGDGAVLSSVQVTGDFDQTPEVTTPRVFTITESDRDVVIAGTGEQVTDTNQVVSLRITLINSGTGETIAQSGYGTTAGYAAVSSAVPAISEFSDALMCARAGSRIVAAFPSTAIDPSAAAQTGISGATGLLAVVDVVDVMRAKADGTAAYNSAPGLPSVVRTPAGAPGLVFPSQAAPTDVSVTTLIVGDGAELSADNAHVVNVMGATWPSAGTPSSVFMNTWSAGSPTTMEADSPESIAAGRQLLPGFAEAFDGATIGSQLMIVIPASENPGGEQNALPAPAGEDLVFVVDVVGDLPKS